MDETWGEGAWMGRMQGDVWSMNAIIRICILQLLLHTPLPINIHTLTNNTLHTHSHILTHTHTDNSIRASAPRI
ncbi:hypothetical protein EON63_21780 [archaeon]|nr:MAG: hypothetical protein EON63_21780 [archaeon]